VTWPVVPLNDLQTDEPRAITDGPFGSNLASRHYTDYGPRVVRLQNIGDGFFIDEKAHISQEHFESLRAHEVLAGDLLIASLGEVLPRACLAPAALGPAIVKADCIRVRLHSDVDPRWVMYAMQRPEVRRWAESHRHGVGRPRLGLKVIRQIPVPLPPLDEQRRIVALLEDHLSRLDAADTYLDAALCRAATLNEQLLDSEVAVKEAETVSLGGLLTVGLANGKSVPTEDGGFPVLRLTALRDGRVDLAERKAGAWSATDAERFLVQRGDFLIARGNGSLRLVGRGGLVTDDPDPLAYPDTLIRARPDPTIISPEFLALVWNAPAIRRQIEKAAKTTAGIYKINQKDVAAVQVPVPALIDQERIVRAVTAARESVSKLGSEVGRSRIRGTALRRSLLAAAFSGQLSAEMATA
jgi:type I restriction enzyme S subunit